MKTTVKRLLALLCVFALSTSMLTACRKSGDDDTSSDSFTSEVIADTESQDISSVEETSTPSSTPSDTPSSTPSSTPSGNSGTSLKGSTVVYATWKDPNANEDGIVVKNFQKKYNIAVKIDPIPQGEYIRTVGSRIASGNSPDVVFDNGEFPSSLSILQPIDAAKLNLSDPIWDQDFINQATVNGKKYLVNTISNIWSEVGCLYYNKKLLKDNNITTPEDYYNAKKWTWEAFEKVMRDVKEKCGSDYIGAVVDANLMLGSLGTGFYKYENGQILSGVSDPIMQEASRRFATWYSDGLLSSGSHVSFSKGKTGMILTDAFGLKKTGYFSTFNSANLGFTYIPDYNESTKAYSTGMFRGWGIAKGAKNPEGAGLFLRFYLDVNNYNSSSAFVTPEAETFFFKLTGVSSASKRYELTQGVCTVTGSESRDYSEYWKIQPDQMPATLGQMKNVVTNNINKVNDFITKNTK